MPCLYASSQCIESSLRSESRSGRGWLVAFVVIIAGIAATLLCIGAVFQRAWEPDVLILLDGGWRVFSGQRPYSDFYTPLGPVTLLIIAGGMQMAGVCAQAIAWSNAALMVVVSAWAWALSAPRMRPRLCFLSAMGAGLTVGGASVYGMGVLNVTHTGYAALYNRYGEAFTILVLIESFWPLRERTARGRAFLGGLSTGAMMALLFFLKENFFAVACGLILAGALVVEYRPARWVGVAIGAVIAAGALLAYLDFNCAGIYRHLWMTVGARSGKLASDFPRILSELPFTLVEIYALLALWWLAPAPQQPSRGWATAGWEQGFLVLCIMAAQGLIFWTCTQTFSPTLFAWAALLVLHGRVENGADRGENPRIRGLFPENWAPALTLAVIPIGMVLLAGTGEHWLRRELSRVCGTQITGVAKV